MQPETGTIAPVLDEEGYLVDPDAWTEEVARMLAAREGIELTGEHWDVIRFMRAFYEDSGEDAFLMQYRLAGDRGDDHEETVNRSAQYEES